MSIKNEQPEEPNQGDEQVNDESESKPGIIEPVVKSVIEPTIKTVIQETI